MMPFCGSCYRFLILIISYFVELAINLISCLDSLTIIIICLSACIKKHRSIIFRTERQFLMKNSVPLRIRTIRH